MPRYATPLAGDPAAVYRSVDVAGRTGAANPHQLVELLYEECVRALRAAAWAAENGKAAVRNERVTRATAILFALESGLDYEQGGDVARTLSTLYSGLRQQIVQASIGSDPAPFRDVADSLAEIAGAWASVRAA
jgi:flagellar secretion chaperone FliS